MKQMDNCGGYDLGCWVNEILWVSDLSYAKTGIF